MANGRALARKLAKRRVWRKIFLDRLAEPLHLNLLSVGVLALGSYRARVDWDLVVRPHYAYGVLKAADLARRHGFRRTTVVEFGVASGAGLLNLAEIAADVSRATGVAVEVHGFDTGAGMPPAVDYRDHPDTYQEGDFGMDEAALRAALPAHARLHLGPLAETVPAFLATLSPDAPLGFAALDVDYYSSSVDALRTFAGPVECCLPLVVLYADDITLDQHNSRSGELLAIAEHNERHPRRPIERPAFLEDSRVFRRPSWLKQIYFVHLLDHPRRSEVAPVADKRHIENPYLGGGHPERWYLGADRQGG